MDHPTRAKKKSRTGVIISIVVHVAVLGTLVFIISKTKMGQEVWERMIGADRVKKTTDKPKPPPAPTTPKGPRPTRTDAPPPSGGRRATDAPAAVDSGLAVDDRTKGKGPATAGTVSTSAPPLKLIVAPPPPRLTFQSAARPSTVQALLAERAKAAASTESFGTEQISKSGVSDVGAIVGKISGATVSEGKFAVVRGLSDRYVSTTLNGVNLPSADPYRQSAPLDLFPAQVIDRVIVTKTFTPDQPGTATGGGIDVITKSFPERQFLAVSLGGDYNTQATGNKNFLTYKGGGTDWAGMDDGSRALPDEINQLAPINPGGQPIPDAPILSGRFGTELFTNTVRDVAIVDKVARLLGTTQFGPTREAPPANHSFSMAGGGVTHLLSKPLGYFFGASYKHDYGFYEDGISRRYQAGTNFTSEIKSDYRDTRSLTVVNWSAMVNLAYQPFEDHELGFTFFYNQNGTDDVRIQDQGFEKSNESSTYEKYNLYWTERNLNTYQMKGGHRFPYVGGLQFNWTVALTQTTQDEPDARFFNHGFAGEEFSTAVAGIPSPRYPTRYFRALDEDNENVKLDWTLPFRHWGEEEGKFKFGLFDSVSERTFTERQFYYPNGRGGYSNDPSRFFTNISQVGLSSIKTNIRSYTYFWGDYAQSFDSLYNGDRDIRAGYLMLDLPVLKSVRLVGGVRYEETDLFVHSESYLNSSVTSMRTNDTDLVQYDLLPAAGLIYSITPNMSVRLNWSETIARPSFRELAAYYSYDPIINDFVEGNPLLEMTASENYDVRWEWFPRPGELFSVSLFYKDIKNAIERGNVKVEGDVITYFNNDAKLYGVEFEARKTLDSLAASFKYFSFGANLSLLESEVELRPADLDAKRDFFPDADDTRPLYDQSPYILNLDLNYSNPRFGTSATLIFSVAGPRVVITRLNTEDVYEQPVQSLDFILSQKLGRRLSFKFSAKNLLNPKIERTYGKDTDLLYSSYTRGRSFGLSLTCDF